MATDYVRVVYRGISANINLDGKIRTYSDIAEVAAIKHLGQSTAANVPLSALSLRGPVAFTEDLSPTELDSLEGMKVLSLGRVIDAARVKGGAWFLLKISGRYRKTLPTCLLTFCDLANILICRFQFNHWQQSSKPWRTRPDTSSGRGTRECFRRFGNR